MGGKFCDPVRERRPEPEPEPAAVVTGEEMAGGGGKFIFSLAPPTTVVEAGLLPVEAEE